MPPIPDQNELNERRQQETKAKQQSQPGRYRLLEGMHVGDNGEQYTRGSIVTSQVDLVERFGAEKFQCIKEPQAMKDAGPAPPPSALQTSFPAGQVHSGKQATTTLPGGEHVTGPEDTVTQQAQDAGVQPDEEEETSAPTAKASATAARGVQAKATPEQIKKAQQKQNQQTQQQKQQTQQNQQQQPDEPKGAEPEPKGAEEDLSKYSVPELKKLAEEDEIDLTGCKTKEEIISRIKES